MSAEKHLSNNITTHIVFCCTFLVLTSICSCKEEPTLNNNQPPAESTNKPPVSSLTRKKLPAITRKENKTEETDTLNKHTEKNSQLPVVQVKKSINRAEKPALKPQEGKTASLPDDRLTKYNSPEKNPDLNKKTNITTIADHAQFTDILQKVVDKNGLVNYTRLKKDIKSLRKYTDYLSGIDADQLINNQEKTAFWINSYNAYTLLMVANNYPVASVRDIFEGKPWDKKWIIINNRQYSLNQIKNDIIRKNYFDPRIHFVLSDASITGPGLSSKAFTGVLLEPMLEARTMSFINGPLNEISANQMELNQIFDLYRQDFGRLIPYISRYSVVKPGKNAKISFREYDWRLNKQ